MQDKRWYTRTLPIISQPFRPWVFGSRKLPSRIKNEMHYRYQLSVIYQLSLRNGFWTQQSHLTSRDYWIKVIYCTVTICQLTRQPCALDLTEPPDHSRLQDTRWDIHVLPHPAMVFGPSRATGAFKAAGYKLKHVTNTSAGWAANPTEPTKAPKGRGSRVRGCVSINQTNTHPITLKQVLWIRIHWIRIRLWIRIQHFKWIRIRIQIQSGFRFWWPKIEETNTAEIFLIFFWSKIAIYSSLGLHKGRPSYRRSLQPSTENIQHFKKGNFINFFLLLPSWIRSRIRIAIPDPDTDPGTPLNPNPIRIRIRIHNTAFRTWASKD